MNYRNVNIFNVNISMWFVCAASFLPNKPFQQNRCICVYVCVRVCVCLFHYSKRVLSHSSLGEMCIMTLSLVCFWERCHHAHFTPTRYNDHDDVIMSATASQITGASIACSTVDSGADERKHQRSASLAFVRGINWWSVSSPHKRTVTQKMFPFDDVIMCALKVAEVRSGRQPLPEPTLTQISAVIWLI